MAGTVIYQQTGDAVALAVPDPSSADFYRDYILVRRFEDVFGHVVADEDGLVMTRGEVFYSTCGVYEPSGVRNLRVGNGDGLNACWSPDPRNATPEYVGVRFTQPARITGFQFSTSYLDCSDCAYGAGPCGYPTAFSLEGSNDETSWTTLLSLSGFTGMRISEVSPYPTENTSWWADGVFLSDRLDLANDHYFLAYRMVVSAFKPDKNGYYNIAELVFYGAF